jgi:uncharacterized protein
MLVILIMIIHRPNQEKRLNELKKWTFVFGRRKTGKTFLVSNFLKSDESFFIKNSRAILTKDNKSISYETFLELLTRGLKEEKVIVVDEFHRLSQDFFDYLHHLEKRGRLILISSTLNLSKNILSKKSALLGLFAEFPLGIIDLKDVLKELKKRNLSKKELLELAILLREPLAVDYFNEKFSARQIIIEVLISSKNTIPALVGEVFSEETRELSAVYEGLLRGIAIGKQNSGELSSYLFSKTLIKKDDPSILQQYLNNLISFGLIKRIPLFNKKKFVYKHISPLVKIFYYIDEKYNFSERNLTEKEMFLILDEIFPRIVEDSVREEIAKKEGLIENLFEEGDFEIDGVLLKFKKPEIALEVKWGKIEQKDISKIEEKLGKIICPKNVLFVVDKGSLKFEGDVLDVFDLI